MRAKLYDMRAATFARPASSLQHDVMLAECLAGCLFPYFTRSARVQFTARADLLDGSCQVVNGTVCRNSSGNSSVRKLLDRC
jgi:hypothetical protein